MLIIMVVGVLVCLCLFTVGAHTLVKVLDKFVPDKNSDIRVFAGITYLML